QCDTHLPAAGEVGAGLVAILAEVEAEAGEDAADARLDPVAIERLELLEEPRLLVDERLDRAHARLDGVRDLFEAELDRAGLGEREPELADERRDIAEVGLLAQVAELTAAMAGAAAIGALLT